MSPKAFNSYEDLEQFLRDWTSWNGEGNDFAGIVRLFAACITNVRAAAHEAEIASFADYFDEQEWRALQEIASWVAMSLPTDPPA